MLLFLIPELFNLETFDPCSFVHIMKHGLVNIQSGGIKYCRDKMLQGFKVQGISK
jgi:hypothetical protein